MCRSQKATGPPRYSRRRMSEVGQTTTRNLWPGMCGESVMSWVGREVENEPGHSVRKVRGRRRPVRDAPGERPSSKGHRGRLGDVLHSTYSRHSTTDRGTGCTSSTVRLYITHLLGEGHRKIDKQECPKRSKPTSSTVNSCKERSRQPKHRHRDSVEVDTIVTRCNRGGDKRH